MNRLSPSGEGKKVVTWYDPPSGWKYGFPKKYEPADNEPLMVTLIRDGYPGLDAEFGAKHCRFWEDAK